jgi:hypothetical protein
MVERVCAKLQAQLARIRRFFCIERKKPNRSIVQRRTILKWDGIHVAVLLHGGIEMRWCVNAPQLLSASCDLGYESNSWRGKKKSKKNANTLTCLATIGPIGCDISLHSPHRGIVRLASWIHCKHAVI